VIYRALSLLESFTGETLLRKFSYNTVANTKQGKPHNMDTIFNLANLLLTILILAIIARALLSWVLPLGRDPWTKILLNITEPILAPIRALLMRILPIPIDFSPIVAILLINFLQN
jgi:YggT family protein